MGNLNTTASLGVGPVDGGQRTEPRGFFYRLEGGVAWIQDGFGQEVGLVLDARIGWCFAKGDKITPSKSTT